MPFLDIRPLAVSKPQAVERSLWTKLPHCRVYSLQAFLHRVAPRAWRQACYSESYRHPSSSWGLSTQKDSFFSWPPKLLAVGLRLSFFVGETD